MKPLRILLLAIALVLVVLPHRARAATFTLTGDPTSTNGAAWALKDTLDGVIYDLTGILFEPSGAGPFPAVIVSHGNGGNAFGYSTNMARIMRGWGVVAIGTNYTHAGGVPIGSPGTASEKGASDANLLRARRLLGILASRPRADTTRVAAHGHSMGGFVTAALVGTTPGRFVVASHTAAGVDDSRLAWTKTAQATGITVPYQAHHGDADSTVDLASDQRLDSLLTANHVIHELRVYPGYGHNAIPFDSTMLARVRAWYTEHGLFDHGPLAVDPARAPPLPLAPRIDRAGRVGDRIELHVVWPASGEASLEIFDPLGRRLLTLFHGMARAGGQDLSAPATAFAPGVLFARARQGRGAGSRGIVLIPR